MDGITTTKTIRVLNLVFLKTRCLDKTYSLKLTRRILRATLVAVLTETLALSSLKVGLHSQ